MNTVFVHLLKDGSVLEISSDSIDIALQIPHFKSRYMDMKDDAEIHITFSQISSNEFMIILNFLRLKHTLNIPFESEHVTYMLLTHDKWNDLLLPREYLKAVEALSIELVVKCMCACSSMSLFELRQLFIYRLIYLLHKNYDTIGSTMKCMVTYADEYDILIFQKQQSKLIQYDIKCAYDKFGGGRIRSKSF
jgi:hypothetical protein